jgi:RNA polymerase sigma-70 factor (ECF subfamily)
MSSLNARQRSDLMAELAGLRRFCLSLTGAAADADDLLQSTIERMLEKGLPEDAHTGKWVYRVCKNIWIDELRSREVRQRHSQTAQTLDGDTSPSAEVQAGDERDLRAVNEALERIPVEQRLALVLVAVEGKSYAEAAEILQVPIGTIMSRIARARKNLMADSALQHL